jgi:SAM-dependent methyltransferase
MSTDPSNGWNEVAEAFMAARSKVGADLVRDWSSGLDEGAAVLDVGAGSGWPITEVLVARGFDVHAVEPAPRLAAALQRRLPTVRVACEPAETSGFFERSFGGAVAIGLVFLLEPATQEDVIRRIGVHLGPGGKFLFSAPRQVASWEDIQTGRRSRSLGEEAYRSILEEAGFTSSARLTDEGGNDYFSAAKPGA